MFTTRTFHIVPPLLAIAAFAYFYSDFSHSADARAAQIANEERAANARKLADEATVREKSIQEALQRQEQRKREREEREAAESARKDARQRAIDAREAAWNEATKLARRIETLKRDVAASETVQTGLLATRKDLENEAAFLKEVTAKTTANQQNARATLDSIVAAHKAALAAEAARKAALAAEAAKKKD